MEALDIDASGEEPDFFRAEAFLDQFASGAPGGDVHMIHLFIVPEGKLPDEILHLGIPGQVLRILRERRVIGAADGAFENARNGQSRQSNGAGGGRMELGEALFVAVVEHLQKRWDEKLEFGVFGEFVDTDGRKIPYAFPGRAEAVVASDDGKILPGSQCQLNLALEGQRDAVHVVVGIGKMRDLHLPAFLPPREPPPCESFQDLFRKLLFPGKHRERHKVGSK